MDRGQPCPTGSEQAGYQPQDTKLDLPPVFKKRIGSVYELYYNFGIVNVYPLVLDQNVLMMLSNACG